MKIKNVLLLSLLILCGCLFFPTSAASEQVEIIDEAQLQEEVIDSLQIDELNQFWQQLGEEYGTYVKDLHSKNFIELMKSREKLSIQSIVEGLFTYLFHEITANGKLLGTLILLTLIASILQTMLTAFEKSTIQKVAHFVVILVLLSITLQSFHITITYATKSIQVMSDFIVALIPLILGLIASLGQLTQVAFFNPIIVSLIYFSSLLITKFVFPLLYVAALLVVISELNVRFKATQLAQLFRSISLTSLGIYLVVFLTILSIQGTVSAIQDGVALKTTKFITSNFIPVIGQTVTDAADTILAASLLIKNSLGIVGLIIIVLYAIFPALKIAVLAFVYKLVAALLQPLAPKALMNSLQTISQYMIYVLACLLAMTFTFFLMIVIIVAASNIPMLLR